MIDARAKTAPTSACMIALVGLVVLFATVALRFANKQSVWTDEATQLSGLGLGFTDQRKWLAGRLPQAFAVPRDRMPPLSYWIGSLWTHVFGSSVQTVRYLSVSLSVASTFALWATARQYLNPCVTLVSVALLALSPNFVVEASEIRAYAAFIFFSILLTYSYLRLIAAKHAPATLDLWTFALSATLCSYTHFFGIVISVGAFLCLFATYFGANSQPARMAIIRKAIWPILFYFICGIALIPFVFAAVRLSGTSDARTVTSALPLSVRIHDFIKLIYRFFGHQSMLGIRGLSAAALVAGLFLMVSAAIPGAHPRGRQLLTFFVVNLALIILAGLTTSAFHAFSPSYNVWVLPVFALIGGTALVHRKRSIRVISALCLGIILAADGYAAMRLATVGEIYGHTRSTILKSAVDEVGVSDAIVLYANDAAALYFALTYDYDGRLQQYTTERSNVRLIGSAPEQSPLELCHLKAETLIVAADHDASAEELQFQIAHPGVHTQAYQTLEQFLKAHQPNLSANWTMVFRDEYLAQATLAVAIFKPRSIDGSTSSTECVQR